MTLIPPYGRNETKAGTMLFISPFGRNETNEDKGNKEEQNATHSSLREERDKIW